MGETQTKQEGALTQPSTSTWAHLSGISLETRLKFASVPSAFSQWTFSTHPYHDELRPTIWRMLNLESWYIWGPFGTGKTGLAVGYAHEALLQGYAVLFRRMPDLFTELRASYNRNDDAQLTEAALLRLYTQVPFLVLDDMGAEKPTDWVADRLYQIIGARHDEAKVTVCTSNLSLPDLGKRIGERITWRIIEMCSPDRILALKGPNLRDLG